MFEKELIVTKVKFLFFLTFGRDSHFYEYDFQIVDLHFMIMAL